MTNMIFLDCYDGSAKPKEEQLFSLLRSKLKRNREFALKIFDMHYSENLENTNDLTIWLSGSVEGYKLGDIRKLLEQTNSKLLTRETKKTELLVVGYKTKVERLPVNIKVISSIAFGKILKVLEERETHQNNDDSIDTQLIELLLDKELAKVEEGLTRVEEQGISLKVLPLVAALFKVHKEKSIRSWAKALLEKESSKTVKELLLFCEGRNFMNAKYTVGIDEVAKIKGFELDLFLYYLVLEQKHHLGKEYLASMDSDWTQKLLEETELLNKESLELYGKAGKRFMFAKKIQHFTVHANSSVLWKMDWLKSLEVIELKEKVILPKCLDFKALETLVLETKELSLVAGLPIKYFLLKECKVLKISNEFNLLNIEHIRLENCSFNLKVFTSFLERTELKALQKIEIKNFTAYKIPKDFKKQIEEILPNVDFSLS